MDVSDIFNHLNKEQRAAVGAPIGPNLVLAGAGSGKTRVLTHRIAWLIQAENSSPLSIMAVTFTNKAAHEMRERLERFIQAPVRGMWVGTFHGLCHRLLRMHYQDAGLPETFEIIDSDDQQRLIKRILKDAGLDESYWPPKQIQWMINHHKEEGRRAAHIPQNNDPQQGTLMQVYKEYENLCQKFGLVDFAEILLRSLELLRNNQHIRETYQQRFRHVLVDEFQDTNAIQYQWLKILCAEHQNIFAVGDDDQSIYGWRGAKVENLMHLQKDFPALETFRLEQNYRSTGNILNASNAVIAHNEGRLGKELWTESGQGTPIKLYTATNEIDEARFVIEEIINWLNKDSTHKRSDIAILYRSNAQSRVFEEQCLKAKLPYRVYGGFRFFERAEIKDALAYLRLINNADSDPAFDRIINLPARGIGNKTLTTIREYAQQQQCPLWHAAEQLIANGQFPPRAHVAIESFLSLINTLREQCQHLDLAEQIDLTIRQSGLLNHFRTMKGEQAQSKVENLEELVNAARNFTPEESEQEIDELTLFLTYTALEAGEGQAESWEDCVQLMSLHSAKGLEFSLVFLCGMEEGLFPHQRSLEEDGRLEEERRLCYVGMTRAMQQLYLCYAEIRRLYGREHYTQCSRFVGEIPEQFLEKIRTPYLSQFKQPARQDRHDKSTARPKESQDQLTGKLVKHPKFGHGIVLETEGQGEHARIQINFDDHGTKWLVATYANLEIMR